MSGCKHELASLTAWPTRSKHWVDSRDLAERAIRWCSTCGLRLPLGPTPPDTEAVAVEKRAAELAASIEHGRTLLSSTTWFTADEHHGWRDYHEGEHAGDCACRDLPGFVDKNWHSGYLARAIANHDAEQGEP